MNIWVLCPYHPAPGCCKDTVIPLHQHKLLIWHTVSGTEIGRNKCGITIWSIHIIRYLIGLLKAYLFLTSFLFHFCFCCVWQDEDAKVKRAFQTLLTYVGNVVKNPNEEKFRKIRLNNPSFQVDFPLWPGLSKVDLVILKPAKRQMSYQKWEISEVFLQNLFVFGMLLKHMGYPVYPKTDSSFSRSHQRCRNVYFSGYFGRNEKC